MLKGQSANVTRDKIPKPKIPPEPQKRKSDLGPDYNGEFQPGLNFQPG